MNEQRKIKVFLVDDVAELRMLIKLTLEEDEGIEVVGEAANGLEGVNGVAAADPDIVLLDLSMPDMDGLEAIPLMRERAPGARLVVLSGHEAGRLSLEAIEQGATRYVNKASDLDTIRGIVREVAQQEPPFTDERFTTVRQMWEQFLDGRIEEMLEHAEADALWRPYTAPGRVLRSRQEARKYVYELLSEGRVVDPRAYGLESSNEQGMVVRGTLEIRGPGGMSETELFWAICFRGPHVSGSAGFDRRDEAVAALLADCP